MIRAAAACLFVLLCNEVGWAQDVDRRPAIAFVRSGSVWVADADGRAQRRILENAELPIWMSAPKPLAFRRGGNIWIANADGSGQRQVTAIASARDDQLQDISYDRIGSALTFDHAERFYLTREPAGADHGPSVLGVSLFDISSSAERALPVARLDATDGRTGFHFFDQSHPAWSPSGKFLAFVRNGDIWIAQRGDAVSPNERAGATTGWSSFHWSVGRVAAVADYDGATLGGSRWTTAATHLAWSPDERALVYDKRRLTGSGADEVHLLALDIDPSRGRLVAIRDRLLVKDGTRPGFTADGAAVTFETDHAIWLVGLDGAQRRLFLRDASQLSW